MTPDQVEELVKATAKATVLETLETLGFNIEDRAALRADMDHLRRWRSNVETVGKASATAIALSVCGLIITALGYGVKVMIGK
jgi:hypothetical protein